MNYQKLIVAGNTTGDAESRKAKESDVSYTTFSVAVGKGKEKPTYFPVVAFGKTGELAAKYLTKGKLVLVEGRIDGGENGRFSVLADRVVFGPGKREAQKPAEEA
jgi:single-strand DNA-binding protein